MRLIRPIKLAVPLAVAITAGHAADTPTPAATVRQTLESRFPDIAVLDVQSAPMPGLFEIFTGDGIAYSNATGDFLLLGSLMDTRTRRNLTAESLDAHNSIDFASLPVTQAIKVVKGNGQRRLAIFADPDCPYCQKLEQELASITDVTIYTYLYPLANLHPDAPAKAHAIWCAKDRSEAWTHWMLERRVAEPEAGCSADPIKDLQALGAKLRINSTPTLFLASGKRISGMLPAAQLEQALSEPSRAASATGATPTTR
jgi:thiol:disulfide interchange protein DsbC